MARQSLDPPARGNPSRLTLRQHVFPARSIERFADSSRRVEVIVKKTGRRFRTGPDNPLFTADRRWDQRAEAGFMRSVERDFQRVADAVLGDGLSRFDKRQREIIHRFYALWWLRSHFAATAPKSLKAVGLTGEHLSEDEFDALEALGTTAFRPNGWIPDRHFNGVHIQQRIDRIFEEAGDLPWGIAKALEGEFIVPDRPYAMLVPIAPDMVLLGQHGNLFLLPSDMRALNRQSVEMSRDFYFARRLADCPL